MHVLKLKLQDVQSWFLIRFQQNWWDNEFAWNNKYGYIGTVMHLIAPADFDGIGMMSMRPRVCVSEVIDGYLEM